MIEEFVGQVIVKIDISDNEILFTMANGVTYLMFHEQDCCESVYVEDFNGDTIDIMFSPVLKAYEESNHERDGDYGDSTTWTFYNIYTMKGNVNIRWCGTSNGYYSESVDWVKTPPSKKFKSALLPDDIFNL